jgi:hypothetical protein
MINFKSNQIRKNHNSIIGFITRNSLKLTRSNEYIKIIKSIDKISDHLPARINKPIIRFISDFFSLVLRLISIIDQLNLNAYHIRGIGRYNKKEINIIFFGKKEFDYYIKNRIFSEINEINFYGRVFLGKIEKRILKDFPKIDIIFIKCDRFYLEYLEKKNLIIIPEWISMELDTSDSIDNIITKFSSSARKDIKKIKKFNYTYEITDEIDKLKKFYKKMYLPYLAYKHGKNAIIYNWYLLKLLIKLGYKLLLIKHNNEYISGSIIKIETKKGLIARFGAININRLEYLKKGGCAAYYYFPILYSIKNNIKKINFGTCKPYFEDGLFRYKKKWGTSVIASDKLLCPDIIGFKVLKRNEDVYNYLINNPFIFRTQDSFYGLFFAKNHQDVELKKEKIYVDNEIKGVKRFLIINVEDILNHRNIIKLNQNSSKKNTLIPIQNSK